MSAPGSPALPPELAASADPVPDLRPNYEPQAEAAADPDPDSPALQALRRPSNK